MKPFEYSYATIRYRQDLATGEVLNVGVVVFSSETNEIGVRFPSTYSRLSEAFADFDGAAHRALVSRLQERLKGLAHKSGEYLFKLFNRREEQPDAGAFMRATWPDQGMAYFMGPVAFGVTENLEEELEYLYDRFVRSQYEREEKPIRVDDAQFWNEVQRVLAPRGITRVLRPKHLGLAEVKFEHAYKNEKWHVIEPVSLDYSNASDMKGRALTTLGKATAVQKDPELGLFTVVVGKPRRNDNKKIYREAMQLLNDLPVEHRIVEGDKAEAFAEELEAEMKEHKILPA